ncbi:MAG: DUF262 domain-containing protein [Deinococcota bacterium]
MSIKPDNPTLAGLLQGRLFFVPDYQRAYSWQSKQRQDLFNDIRTLAKHPDPERHHFMATVVCLQRGKQPISADDYGRFEVVDGQQRLTTLVILLKAIAKALAGQEGLSHEATKLNHLLVKEDGSLLFTSNHDKNNVLVSYLRVGSVPDSTQVTTAAERNLAAACQDCEHFVETWLQQDGDLLGLLRVLKNRLEFILFTLTDEATVYTTFEVLNSRGLEVDWLDKCKSMLMGVAAESFHGEQRTEQLDTLHTCFQDIYATIGLDSLAGQEILRFTACLNEPEPPNRIPSSEAALASLQARVNHAPDCTTSTAHKLLQVTKALKQLRDNWKITALTRVAHVRLLAAAILLADNDVDAQLAAWERVTFRIFGLARRDARTKVGEYTRLAHVLLQADGLQGEDAVKAITALGSDYKPTSVISSLHHSDAVHGWEDELRYFFYHYDQHLAQLQGEAVNDDLWASICQKPSSQVIELIYPEGATNAWPKLSEARQESRYYLGNVLITAPRVNLLTGQKDFAGKREVYSQFAEVRAGAQVSHEESWGYNQIVAREKRLLEWAKQYWAEP